ncbi:hypothetical protein Pint_20833 [Pistacia integerrima]|uniref:Uncharacterized protein n=1 Tax=Pistacia integerrima TaxID=434235 RepID=A0ACC0X8R0_9ROSI|nr:hypothetical protein Pint_20833 [Pistacia integerrima]
MSGNIKSSSSTITRVPSESPTSNSGEKNSIIDNRLGPKITEPKTTTIKEGTNGDGPLFLIALCLTFLGDEPRP